MSGKVLQFPPRKARCAACGDTLGDHDDPNGIHVCSVCQEDGLHVPEMTSIFSCANNHPRTGMFWVTTKGVHCSKCGRISSFSALQHMVLHRTLHKDQ